MLAVGLAAWSTARVGYMHDEMVRQAADYSNRTQQQQAAFTYHAIELQTNYLLHVAQQASETEKEITHYREQFQKLERQYRMTELKYDNVNLTVRRAGLALPNDYWTGPGGNLDAEAFHVGVSKVGAGGIINQHAEDLLASVLRPGIYNCLSKSDKDKVELIKLKPFLARTQDDVNYLLDKLNGVCRR